LLRLLRVMVLRWVLRVLPGIGGSIC